MPVADNLAAAHGCISVAEMGTAEERYVNSDQSPKCPKSLQSHKEKSLYLTQVSFWKNEKKSRCGGVGKLPELAKIVVLQLTITFDVNKHVKYFIN